MKRRITLGLLTALALAGLLWLALRREEPSYAGKAVTRYLDEFARKFPGQSEQESLRPIRWIGPEAIPYLRKALRKEDSTPERILNSVRPRLPKAVSNYLPPAKGTNYGMAFRHAAIVCLAWFGPDAREAIPDLIAVESLNPPNNWNAAWADFAIHEIGPRPQDTPAFLAMLSSTNLDTPRHGANSLAKIGACSPEVLTALGALAARPNASPYARLKAIDSLGALGPKAVSTEPVLRRTMSDPDASIRIASAVALWRVHGKSNESVEWLTHSLEHEIHNVSLSYQEVVLRLVRMAEEIGTPAEPAAPQLRLLKGDQNFRLRLEAGHALWVIDGETNNLSAIYYDVATNTTYPEFQLIAAEYLSEFCVKHRVDPPELAGLLSSQDSFVRFFAARAFWRLYRDKTNTLPFMIDSLQDHFTHHRNKDIRRSAAETLGELGPDARAAVPALMIALKDPWEEIRVAATNALKRIDPEAAARAGAK